MHRLTNRIAGAAGMALLLGAFAATPGWASGRAPTSDDQASVAAPDLGMCSQLEIVATQGVYHVYAEGVQIYRWDGLSWVFLAPDATLYADANLHGRVGSHYAGPTWESNSGSKVVGRVADRCFPDSTAIPWLKLDAISSQGPGIFDGVTGIQRVNTVGGIAPSTPGSFEGDVRRVPYTAEYYFYHGEI